MWYFAWMLGVGLAAAFAVLNAMWFELDADREALVKPAGGSKEAGSRDGHGATGSGRQPS